MNLVSEINHILNLEPQQAQDSMSVAAYSELIYSHLLSGICPDINQIRKEEQKGSAVYIEMKSGIFITGDHV